MKSWAYPLIGSVLSIAALLLILSVPLASIALGPSRHSSLYFARVDATNSNIKDALEEDKKRDETPKANTIGLPDRYDDEKLKQKYFIYLLNYCSGTVAEDGKVTVDFCSRSSEEIWDLFALWSTYDPINDPGSKHGKLRVNWLTERPDWLRFGYAATAILAALSVGVGFIGPCMFRRGHLKWVTFSASVLSTIFMFAVVAATQVTFGLIVFHAEEQNSIRTKKGVAVYVVNWFALAFSIAASTIWFIYCRKILSSRHPGSPAAKKRSKDLEATPYKYEEVKDDVDGDGTHTPKGHARGQSMDVLHAHRAGHDVRFEPMRPKS